MSDFRISTTRLPGRMVVSVAGECDLRHRDEMTTSLQEAVEAAPEVEVDLGGVRFLDSSGLHALVTASQAARRRDGIVYVINATGTVAMVLEMTGVLRMLRPPTPAP